MNSCTTYMLAALSTGSLIGAVACGVGAAALVVAAVAFGTQLAMLFAVAAAVAADANAVLSICPSCAPHTPPSSQAPPYYMPLTMQTIGRTRQLGLPGR